MSKQQCGTMIKVRLMWLLWLLLTVSLLGFILVLCCVHKMELDCSGKKDQHLPNEDARRDRHSVGEQSSETPKQQYIQQIKALKAALSKTEKELIQVKTSQQYLLDFGRFVKSKLLPHDIIHGVSLKTEFEDVSFNRFTLNRIYLVDPGLGKRVIEKPIGYKKKDLNDVLLQAVQSLNSRRRHMSDHYKPEHLVEGLYRNVPTIGSQYELYFVDLDNKTKDKTGKYIKVSILRAYGPQMVQETKVKDTTSQHIDLIVPLSGRVDKLKLFIDHYTRLCVLRNEDVSLTIVYFGQDGLIQVRSLLDNVSRSHQHHAVSIKLVTLDGKFSRGRGLQAGAEACTRSDTLLFLCDVDILFSLEFLQRCRLNSEAGHRVYYPIVFSLYNPHVVYLLHDSQIPPQPQQLVISKETGFWRDFGYGMTCQYLSDFKKIGGFDADIRGWGGEDVHLYRKYIRSTMMVVRATDPGIFHLWHSKDCDQKLSSDQYRSCIRSKALNEASHAQLGLLAFKNEVDLHRSYKKKLKLAR